jgi:hypothetical protein
MYLRHVKQTDAKFTSSKKALTICSVIGSAPFNKYLIDLSILLILLNPQLWQIVTAFVDQAVVNVSLGPTSITTAFSV